MEKRNSKPTNAQLQRRIENAVVFVPKVKDTKSIYFTDRGVRLTVTSPSDFDGYAVIETNYHKHVYSEINPQQATDPQAKMPFSRVWLFTLRVIEIANENLKDIEVGGGYSYQRLLDVLKAKENKEEYNIVFTYDLFLFNSSCRIHDIGEDPVSYFFMFESFAHNVARNNVLLEEGGRELTNKQFIEKMIENIRAMFNDMDEYTLLIKKTDEEIMRENMEAVMATEQEQAMEAQINESQD